MEDIKGLLNPSWAQNRIEEIAQRLDLPEVAPELERRFTEATLTEKPDLDLQAFPLKDGFDALVYHFNQVRTSSYPEMLSCLAANDGRRALWTLSPAYMPVRTPRRSHNI